jgi:hypothetical protein
MCPRNRALFIVDLDGMSVTCSMVYWADFLHDKPASPGAAHEASEMELE